VEREPVACSKKLSRPYEEDDFGNPQYGVVWPGLQYCLKVNRGNSQRILDVYYFVLEIVLSIFLV
jgi:hypothetical protein